MKGVALVFVLVTAANAVAFRPEFAASWQFWLSLLLPYALGAAAAVRALQRQDRLREVLRPRWGDLSLGAASAAALLLASWIGRSALSPSGSERGAWLYRVYLHVGSSDSLQRSVLLTAALMLIPIFEELVWRSLVLDTLTKRLGSRRAPPVAALLYAASLLPTIHLLADPQAGPNPLLFVAAIGCGLVWSYSASLLGRLPPVMISHMAFTYFSAVQFRFPGA
ncbi:MAG: CPBP family intramembrane glutamic endopeptidase [Polyangiaceae bacterium]